MGDRGSFPFAVSRPAARAYSLQSVRSPPSRLSHSARNKSPPVQTEPHTDGERAAPATSAHPPPLKSSCAPTLSLNAPVSALEMKQKYIMNSLPHEGFLAQISSNCIFNNTEDPGCKVTLLQTDERIAPADQVQSADLDHGGHDVLPTAHYTHSYHLLSHEMFQDQV
ncbi:hypothetical protein AOLI_G00186100 [Acnodon oligacanthus]